MTANGIVCDGAGRWRAGAAATIRTKVIAACAERFHKANRWGRLLLRVEVEREVSRRVKDVTPPSRQSLY